MQKELEITKKTFSNPPIINYSEFQKTTEEKLELKAEKLKWFKKMREKHLLFEKRKWGQMHLIWNQ